MLTAASRAAAAVFSRAYAGLLGQAVLFAVVLFALLAGAVWWAIDQFLPTLGWPWINEGLEVVAPLLTFLLVFILGAPVAALYVGVFLEAVAGKVEARDYPSDPPAKGVPLARALAASAGLAAMVLAINLALLPMHLVPLIGTTAIVAVNAYLLGREFFDLVALRHVPLAQVKALRRAHRGVIFLAGAVVALLALVPIVNLAAPLFATIFMVHLFKGLPRDAAL